MPAHVQDVFSGTLSGSGPKAVSITTSNGSLLTFGFEAYVSTGGAISLSSVTDSAGNTWTFSTSSSSQDPPAISNNYSGSSQAFVAAGFAANAAAVTSVTINYAGSLNPVFITISEFSGVPASAAIDAAAASGTTGSGTSQATPSITTSYGNDVIIAQTAESAHAWTAVSSPYTLVASTDTAWAIPGAAGSQQATFSGGASQSYYASLIMAIGSSAAPPNRPRGQAVNRASTY